jgi:hypothetical protein
MSGEPGQAPIICNISKETVNSASDSLTTASSDDLRAGAWVSYPRSVGVWLFGARELLKFADDGGMTGSQESGDLVSGGSGITQLGDCCQTFKPVQCHGVALDGALDRDVVDQFAVAVQVAREDVLDREALVVANGPLPARAACDATDQRC